VPKVDFSITLTTFHLSKLQVLPLLRRKVSLFRPTLNFLGSIGDFPPLDEGLILTTDREHGVFLVAIDLNVGNVLGVPTVAARFVALVARATVHVHQAVIVACRQDRLVVAHLDDVDMAAIGARREDALDEPAKLNSMVHPGSRSRVRGAARILLLDVHIEEQELICATARSDLATVERPVNTCDETGVALQFAERGVLAVSHRVVQVDKIVVRAYSKLAAIGIVAHDFDPLLRVVHGRNDVVKAQDFVTIGAVDTVDESDRDTAVVVTHSEMLEGLLVGETASLLVRVQVAHRARTTSLFLGRQLADICHGRDTSFANAFLGSTRVEQNRVIVTRAEVEALIFAAFDDSETPGLTIEVRPDLCLSDSSRRVREHVLELKDRTIGKTGQDLIPHEVNGAGGGLDSVRDAQLGQVFVSIELMEQNCLVSATSDDEFAGFFGRMRHHINAGDHLGVRCLERLAECATVISVDSTIRTGHQGEACAAHSHRREAELHSRLRSGQLRLPCSKRRRGPVVDVLETN